MSLTRTASGLANEHLFYSVDYVVYVEGGCPRSLADILAGAYDSSSDDVRFWRAIFEIYLPDKRCKFKAVGSKPVLVQLARSLNNAPGQRTLVCMDRDFDIHTGNLINHNAVYYTYGYSWENDVWNFDVLEKVFYILCPGCPIEINVTREIRAWWNQLSLDLRWPVYADFFLLLRGHSYRGIRGKPRRIISTTPGGPQLNIRQLRADFTVARRAAGPIRQTLSGIQLNALQDCYGHFLSSIVIQFLNRLLRSRCGRRNQHSSEALNCMAVEALRQLLAGESVPVLKQHYSSQFVRI